jgi:WD40 repeat protein
MQYVAGTSLQDLLDERGPLELPDILRIGMQIASGLAAAHAQGLVHRDIKPANILLQVGGATEPVEGAEGERTAVPGVTPPATRRVSASGVGPGVPYTVKITDFGLARAAEDVKLTQTGFVAGTPLYMAPEQARGEPLDHRADLFSLGSVLYAMCTGKPPFDGSTPFLVLKRVTEEPPRPIHEINPAIPDWLVAIIDRLHAKHPADRFQSAGEVAALLERHLAEVQVATPAKTATPRRSRVVPRAAAPGSGRFWTLSGLAVWGLLGVLALTEATGLTRFRVAPAAGRTAAEEEASPALRKTLNATTGPIWSVAISPDDRLLAMGMDDGTLRLWNPATGEAVRSLEAHAGPVWSVAFNADGTRMATASDDGTVKLWDTATKELRQTFEHETAVRPVAFSPDGRRLVTGGRNGRVIVWDVATAKKLVPIKGHKGVIMAVAFSPDGKVIASAGSDKVVRLWDAATGEERVSMPGHAGGVYGLAFAPDGTRLASVGWDRTVRLWDAAAGSPVATLTGHTQDVWGVAFSPDGQTLGSASEDRTVKLWDVASGKERTTLRGHTGTVYAVAFAHDGKTVASGGRDGTVKLWDATAR